MTPYSRRTPEQWQAIVTEQAASPLSAPQFCKDNDIAYASFSKWRKKLEPASVVAATPKQIDAPFVELTASNSSEQVSQQWHIELDIAPGVQLRIAR